jgi:hypothetical protein
VSRFPTFEIKWYHLLFGVLGIIFVLGVIVITLMNGRGPSYFVEDETDIVEH